MHAEAARTDWKRYLMQALLGCALLACALLCPPLGFAMAYLSPLLLCPIATDSAAVWLLPLATTVGLWLGGVEPLLATLTLLCPYACLLVNHLQRQRNIGFNRATIGHITAILLSMLPLAVYGAHRLGGDLFGKLSELAVAWLGGSAQSGTILYRLVSAGFLTAPTNYQGIGAIQLGGLVFLNPSLQDELLKMLRLRLNETLASFVPSLMVQFGMIVGLLAALLSSRAAAKNAACEDRIAPSFLTLQLPKAYRGYVLFLAIASLLCSFSDNGVTSIVRTLTYTAFVTVYRLLGAATLMFLMGHKSPRYRPLHALIATALYVLAPIILFILGVADQFLHLRAATLYHSKED